MNHVVVNLVQAALLAPKYALSVAFLECSLKVFLVLNLFFYLLHLPVLLLPVNLVEEFFLLKHPFLFILFLELEFELSVCVLCVEFYSFLLLFEVTLALLFVCHALDLLILCPLTDPVKLLLLLLVLMHLI